MPLPPHTRSNYQPDHLLQTPDTFVRAALPGLKGAQAIIHAAPAMGARFTAYTVELETGGSFGLGRDQSFVYVLEGEIETEAHKSFTQGGYFYHPPGLAPQFTATSAARAFVIEKPFLALEPPLPEMFSGRESDLTPQAMNGDEALEVRTMVPDNFTFDMAVNTMTFQPGAQLPRVEIHVMEHALLMLEGEGIYRLGERWYPTRAGDFIWMAPYCPQWFGALGKKPTKYLIYKDWNRHPLAL